jgi:uncharacterized protein (TIGR02246 family)
MKNTGILFSTILLFSLPAFAQTETENPEIRTKSGKEVFAAVAKWADAVRSRDTKALELLFADDLIVTTFDGKTRGKKEELEVLKPNELVKTISVNNDEVKIRVYGRAAVVTALTKMHFVISEKNAYSNFRYTAVFVKQDGRWQIVALQTARAPDAAKSNEK